jgi:hypothetical protein
VKANASIKDATSHVTSIFSYPLTDDVATTFIINTPHHYNLTLITNFKDRFKDTAANLNLFKLTANLECDE